MKRLFKVKYSFVPFLGELDKYSKSVNERILNRVEISNWQTSTQLLKRNDIVEYHDVVWVPSKNQLFCRFINSNNVLICVPYEKIDYYLEEIKHDQ